jgi:hypothetical protein
LAPEDPPEGRLLGDDGRALEAAPPLDRLPDDARGADTRPELLRVDGAETLGAELVLGLRIPVVLELDPVGGRAVMAEPVRGTITGREIPTRPVLLRGATRVLEPAVEPVGEPIAEPVADGVTGDRLTDVARPGVTAEDSGRWMLGTASRERSPVVAEVNGELPLVESCGCVEVPARVCRGESARRLRSATVVRVPMLRTVSGASELSRASNGLTSRLLAAPTRRKTLSISSG